MGLAIFVVAAVSWAALSLISCVILFFTARSAFSGEPRWRAIATVIIAMILTTAVTLAFVHYLAHLPTGPSDFVVLFRAIAAVVGLPFMVGAALLSCSGMIGGTR